MQIVEKSVENISRITFRIIVIVILVSGISNRCNGQIKDTLAFCRYNDNFVALSKDTSHKFTLLPGIKALYFTKDKSSYIGFGGDVREQGQLYYHEGWGMTANEGDPYILQRLMFHTNVQLTKYLRLFGDLSSSVENGRNTGPRPGIDVDKLDLHQGFADINFMHSDSSSITLRAGRQELNYGSGRLVNNNEGQNVKLAFQGLKLITNFQGIRTDIFYTTAVNNQPGVFDDKTAKSTRFYAVYSTIDKYFIPDCTIDLYAFGYHNDQAFYVRDTAKENRYSLGTRIHGVISKSFVYELEGTYQFGKIGAAPISAYMMVGRFTYNFDNPALQPAIGLVVQIASGDKTGSTQNTYNPLYARDYYGIGVPYWSANLYQIAPTFEIKPIKGLILDCAIHSFWRESLSDGLYLGNSLTRSPNINGTNVFSDKRFMGFQFEFNPVYNVSRYFAISSDLAIVPASAYIRETGPAGTLFFSDVQLQFRF